MHGQPDIKSVLNELWVSVWWGWWRCFLGSRCQQGMIELLGRSCPQTASHYLHFIPHITVYYPVPDSSPHVPTLRQFNRFHSSSWLKVILVLSYLSLGFPSGLFPSGLLAKTCHPFSCPPLSATCPPISIFLISSPNNTWWIVQTVTLCVKQCSQAPFHLIPLRPKYLPVHPQSVLSPSHTQTPPCAPPRLFFL
jgi:hypothetical protein